MKISYHWLQSYIALPDPATLGTQLTALGLEVESIEKFEAVPGSLAGLVIGEVLTCEAHPNADKLRKTTVDIGQEAPVPIVCGASNVAAGQKVVVATVGATLYPSQGEPFEIKKAKIRGEASEGMICAEDEIGLGTSHAGIMVLDTDLPNGTPAADYFQPYTDYTFEIGLTPNRADAASHWGVARDLKALYQTSLCRPEVADIQASGPALPIEVVVENPEACLRYAGVSLTGLKVGPSPEWLQNRLKAIGQRPINNVVDITNFVLHELGQPLHAFDADQVKGRRIRVKTLPEGTEFTTLDAVKRKLGAQDLMICDDNSQGLCIAGVFGGLHSGVNEGTQHVFLESAYFDPGYIRRTSQRHGLKTDASFRFERGTDPNGVVFALQRAALLIQELAGGSIASDLVDIYPQPVAPFVFPVRYRQIDRLIGKNLDRDFIKETLKALDIEVQNESETGFTVQVPPYRVDVQREADIIEELARVYGYDQLEVGQHLGAHYLAEFPEKDAHKIQFQLSQSLAALGYAEMMNNSLTKPEYADLLPEYPAQKRVEILNKLSEELGVMRQTLLFSGLEVLAYNLNRRQTDLKFFEFGKVYFREGQQPGLEKFGEKTRLALFLTGLRQEEHWRLGRQKSDFYDLAQVVALIFQKMNLSSVQTEPSTSSSLAYGLRYLDKKGQEIGQVGKVAHAPLKALDIKVPVLYADLDWEYLLEQYQSGVKFEEISKFPEVRRDLSLVLDKSVAFQTIAQLARDKERKLLKSLNVFDVYEGENIGLDKKAYALSFILEDKTQTLTDKVIEKTMQKLMQAFENELGAIIRK
ncbi:MAG: phenylalanine--tRNA ligase subunit beta [Microscillaceae bacterium]